MVPFLEISDRCISCDACRLICPEGSIIENNNEYNVEQWSCTLCFLCTEICPVDCIKLIEKENNAVVG